MKEIPTTYNQAEEENIYKLWEKSGYFNPDNLEGEPFSIMMPPPNATGTLHIGHAFESSIQDIIVRYHRMKGEKTLWLPGTDHAAIATNTKVEKILIKEEGKNRHEIGREAFVKKVEEFVTKSRGVIQNQIRRIGASADWSREAFTFDDQRNLAVRTAFKLMYDAGLIYRGIRVINWDPKGQTAVSDDEVTYKAEKGELYTFKYSKDFPIAIATTRPETKVGDTAVAVNPKDKRYTKFVGKEYEIEFAGAKLKIKIVADDAVDMEFGTGAVGVTPAHSIADFEIAQRHNLPTIQVINEYARMTEIAGPLVAGKKTKEAREIVATWLSENELLEKTETIDLNLSTAERSGGVIEPLPKLQWFVNVNKKTWNQNVAEGFSLPSSNGGLKTSATKDRMTKKESTLKELMHEAVSSGKVKIMPERFEKVYFHWIDNLRDWNISRQLWYGHRIPVWYCDPQKAGQQRMGVHGSLVNEWLQGKTRTYRTRDHGLKIGDNIAFENSETKILIGYGKITDVQKTTVGGITLPDMKHSGKYKTTPELIAAFKRMTPEKDITAETEAWVYDFEFKPISKESAKDGCGQIIANIDEPKKCPACGGSNLVQDPDTLDTWFSSALWTFSTLGWPNKTKDLKTFHPTAVMAPGYEILFFWVARMILMSTFLLGEVPFKLVYLHGIVRDITGKKFSKSLDNGIDPVEVINQFGADALRMALVIGVGAGNDSKYDMQKVKGYRNFANKVWNAARFVISNSSSPLAGEDVPPSGGTDEGKIRLTKDDQAILDDLNQLVKTTTEQMEKYDFAHAGEDLYHYFWHTFADKIIEESKAKLNNPETRASAQLMLTTVLETFLKLLHPFIPFVTESIWQIQHKDLLMIQRWPTKKVISNK